MQTPRVARKRKPVGELSQLADGFVGEVFFIFRGNTSFSATFVQHLLCDVHCVTGLERGFAGALQFCLCLDALLSVTSVIKTYGRPVRQHTPVFYHLVHTAYETPPIHLLQASERPRPAERRLLP